VFFFKTFLFADDTSGLNRGKNLRELVKSTNEQLKKWAQWFRANKLKVNTQKTKFIIFHPKGKKVDFSNLDIVFDDNDSDSPFDISKITKLDRVHMAHQSPDSRYYKLLGVLLDENLTFNDHVSCLCSKLSRSIYCLNKVKNFLPPQALKTLYFSLIHSHLLYCLTIYSCTSKSNLEKIAKMQR